MVGEWIDEEEGGAVIQSSCKWSRNRNFLIRNFTSTQDGEEIISGTQWIGWDPIKGKIRSWLFDSNGGYGEGNWRREGDRWIIESKAVLPSAKLVREMHIITLADPNTMTFESKDRTIEGEPLPDIKEMVVHRQPEVGN